MTDTTPPPAGKGLSGRLTTKYGGIPAWVILAITAAVVAGFWLYRLRRKNPASQTTAATTAINTATDSGSGTAAYAASGGGGGGTVTTANGAPAIASNAQWALQATNALVASGNYTATDISNALSKYLNGQPVTPQEQAIINLAIQTFSAPPEGVLPVNNAPTSAAKTVTQYVRNSAGEISAIYSDGTSHPLSFPEWSALAAQGAQYVQQDDTAYSSTTHRYVVQQGDTAASIATRFYGNAAYAGNVPTPLTPGQTITLN